MNYQSIKRKTFHIGGPVIFAIIGINAIHYGDVASSLARGYTKEQIEERFNTGSKYDILRPVFSFVGRPGRELAYRMHGKEKA